MALRALVQSACFECRRASRCRATVADVHDCPSCGQDAVRVGRDFAAPRRNGLPQWSICLFLFAHGFRFDRQRNAAGRVVPYPTTFGEARTFAAQLEPLNTQRVSAMSHRADARTLSDARSRPPWRSFFSHGVPLFWQTYRSQIWREVDGLRRDEEKIEFLGISRVPNYAGIGNTYPAGTVITEQHALETVSVFAAGRREVPYPDHLRARIDGTLRYLTFDDG